MGPSLRWVDGLCGTGLHIVAAVQAEDRCRTRQTKKTARLRAIQTSRTLVGLRRYDELDEVGFNIIVLVQAGTQRQPQHR